MAYASHSHSGMTTTTQTVLPNGTLVQVVIKGSVAWVGVVTGRVQGYYEIRDEEGHVDEVQREMVVVAVGVAS